MGVSQLEVFAPGHTPQFTWQASLAPDAAPILKVTGIAGSVVASITAIQSDATHYYALFTMPTSEGRYLGEWFALKTVSGSAYQVKAYQWWEVRDPDRVRD